MLFGAFDTSGCYGERQLNITFEPEPYINLGQDRVLECWDQVNIYAQHNGTHLQWSTGETGDQVTVMHSQTLTAFTESVCGTASDTVQVV